MDMKALASETARQIETLEIIRQMVSANGRADLLPLVRRDLGYVSLINLIQSGNVNRAELLRRLRRFIPYALTHHLPLNLAMLVLSATYFLSPRGTRIAYLAVHS